MNAQGLSMAITTSYELGRREAREDRLQNPSTLAYFFDYTTVKTRKMFSYDAINDLPMQSHDAILKLIATFNRLVYTNVDAAVITNVSRLAMLYAVPRVQKLIDDQDVEDFAFTTSLATLEAKLYNRPLPTRPPVSAPTAPTTAPPNNYRDTADPPEDLPTSSGHIMTPLGATVLAAAVSLGAVLVLPG